MEGPLPIVSYSTGTMNSLVYKLAKMKNHSNSSEEFSDLTQEFKEAVLSLKEDFLDKHAVPKVCMKQVRELVFEIEDWIDQKPDTNMLDPSDKEEIGNFMTEIKEARERFTWYYNLLKIVPTEPDVAGVVTSNINIDPRLLVGDLYCHGLFDGPRDELVKHLTEDKEQMRKVVCVVGMEGLGKTTLAKEIYSEIQPRLLFECQAFVSIGKRTSLREILNSILRQVKPWSEKLEPEIAVDVQDIITELREYLNTKRYFIIIDAIWSTWAWKIINCALPNNRGSRVLITTCIMDVGRSCCSYPNDLVYQIEALSKKNSRILFLSTTKTIQEEEKGASFEEDSGYMVNMCGGMPLAITVAAGLLLATKSEKLAELKMIREYIHSSLKQTSSCEGMARILHMSYVDLCLPLRSCFLYLTVFPENYTIKKDRLIRLWGAEEFIPRIDEKCLWVTGERYFNELISRRLIQPVFNCDDDQAVGCTIHTVILDFIRSLSREENFVTSAAELSSGPFPCDTIRRYSMDCRNEDEAGPLSTSNVHLSNFRSLIVLGDANGMFDPPPPSAPPAIRASTINLSAFKLLRVLDLEDTRNLKHCHLDGIGGLVLLRYLGLAGTGIITLPRDIGRLEQLETLDLTHNGIILYFPASVVKLKKVTHLLLQVDAKDIWEMPEIEVASNINAWSRNSLRIVVELLKKSEKLRVLGLTLSTSGLAEIDLMSFIDEVLKSKLQSLSLDIHYSSYGVVSPLVNSWEKVTASPGKKIGPQRFELRITSDWMERVPPNMDSLTSLTHLDIHLCAANSQDFHVLGGLTNLVLLKLTARFGHGMGKYIIRKGIFPSLKVFSFKIIDSWKGLEFEKGAMPQLQMLGRSFKMTMLWNKECHLDIGIEHLPCLKRIHAIISCHSATVSEVEEAEADIRGQVSQIATRPRLELSRDYEYAMRGDKQEQHPLVNPSVRRLVSEESTSIPHLEDNDQITEDEGQHFILDTSTWRVTEKDDRFPFQKKKEKDDRSTLEPGIEDEDQTWKDEGKHSVPKNEEKHSVPSKNKVFENVEKSKKRWGISSLFHKMKDAGRKLVASPNVHSDCSKSDPRLSPVESSVVVIMAGEDRPTPRVTTPRYNIPN